MNEIDQIPDTLRLEACAVELRTRKILGDRGGKLTTREEQLLRYLVRHAGQTVTQDALLADVWGYAPNVRTLAVYRAMKRLRDKVERDPASPRHLLTVHGEGYRFEPLHADAAGPEEGDSPQPTPRPIVSGDLIGRADELAELKRTLDRSRLVSVLGPAGVGKTRLVLELLDEQSGSTFVDLSDADTENELFQMMELQLGIQSAEDDRADAIGKALARTRTQLLILDNVEQILELVTQHIPDWLEGAPDSRVIVTSRQRLPLSAGQAIWLGPLSPESGAELLMRRGSLAGAENLDRKACEELASQLDGLPLAIALAAHMCRTMTPQRVSERMGERLSLLRTRDADVPDRQATLRAAIAWSWDLLEPWEQAALAQCSVFAGGWSMDLAEQVIDIDDFADAPPVHEVMGDLCDKSMVMARTEPAMRFYLLQSIASFASERMRHDAPPHFGSDATHAAERRHVEALAALHADPHMTDTDLVPWMLALTQDRENLRVAAQRAFAWGEVELAAKVVRVLFTVMSNQAALPPLIELLERALDAGPSDQLRLELLVDLGAIQRALRKAKHGLALLDEARELATRLGDDLRLGMAETYIGNLRRSIENTTAEDNYDRAIALFDKVGNTRWLAIATATKGVGLWEARKPGARECYARSIQLFQQIGSRQEEAISRCNIALLDYEAGRTKAAVQQASAAVEIFEQVNRVDLIPTVLSNIGVMLFHMGQPQEARDKIVRALEVTEEHGYVRNLASLYSGLAEVEASLGNQTEAETAMSEALRLLDTYPGSRPSHLAQIACREGQVAVAGGRLDYARTCLARALEHAPKDEDRGAQLRRDLQRLRQTIDDLSASRTGLDEAIPPSK